MDKEGGEAGRRDIPQPAWQHWSLAGSVGGIGVAVVSGGWHATCFLSSIQSTTRAEY